MFMGIKHSKILFHSHYPVVIIFMVLTLLKYLITLDMSPQLEYCVFEGHSPLYMELLKEYMTAS